MSGGIVARLDAIYVSLIISAHDVIELEAVEFVLKAPHLLAVGFHLGIVVA
jgi:hypothetical protein